MRCGKKTKSQESGTNICSNHLLFRKTPKSFLNHKKPFPSIFSFILYCRSSERDHGPLTRQRESDKKILKRENLNGVLATREQANPSVGLGLLTDQRQTWKRDQGIQENRLCTSGDGGHINVFIPEGQMSIDEAIVQGATLTLSSYTIPNDLNLSLHFHCLLYLRLRIQDTSQVICSLFFVFCKDFHKIR